MVLSILGRENIVQVCAFVTRLQYSVYTGLNSNIC